MNRQLYMSGGIMNAVPREQYGLGSVFKGVKNVVKKATGAVKDIASSDVGKMALTAAAAYYAPAMFGGTTGFGPTSTYGGFARGLMSPNLIGPMTTKGGGIGRGISSFLGTGKGKLAAGSVLASLFAGMSAADQADIDEVDIDERGDVVAEKLRQSLTRLGYTGQVLEDKVAEGVAEYTGYTSKAEGGRIGYAEGTEEPLEPINIGIGTFNPQRVVDLYEKAKNIPKNISLEDISLEDIKGIPKRLMEGTKSSISSMVEPLGNEYRAYMEFFSLPEKDKKKMEEMGLGIFDVFEYLAMRDNKAQGGRIGFDNGSPREFDVGNFRELMIQDMIKKSPDGIVMDGERDTFILDSLREEDGDKGLDPSFPPVEYDDGTIYYPKTDEYYKIDGTQVDGISPGAKPVPKVLEAAQGGRIGFKDGGMDRRGFLKLMGGLAALPIVGKFFKGAKVASKVVPLKGTTTAMPAWFPDLVDKFVAKGVGKKIDQDLMEYTTKELPGIKMTKHDDGRIYVEGLNDYSRGYDIEYQPPGYELLDETTGKAVKTKGNFTASEEVPVNMDPSGNVDFDGEILESVDDILTSDARTMEEFATGRKISFKEKKYKGESRVGEAEVRLENEADAYAERMAEEADEFASGGLAKLLGE